MVAAIMLHIRMIKSLMILLLAKQDHGLIPGVTQHCIIRNRFGQLVSVHMHNQCLEKAETHQTSELHLVKHRVTFDDTGHRDAKHRS